MYAGPRGRAEGFSSPPPPLPVPFPYSGALPPNPRIPLTRSSSNAGRAEVVGPGRVISSPSGV
ncbi:hypothetical protein E4K73_23560 [Streptomyces sp. IB201691-2A2]|nr:hypothetical protein E4K73_23560 [Streptomyces sp. IB201691-2A2]